MSEVTALSLSQWITVVEVPLIIAIFGWIMKMKGEQAAKHEAIASALARVEQKATQDLYDFKLQAAQAYATSAQIQEVERRMLDGIRRIETKVDTLNANYIRVLTHQAPVTGD